MSDVIKAIKHVYYLNNGAAYDKTALQVLAAYKRGGPVAVTSLLQTPELHADPCAKLFRELLKVKTVSRTIFGFCQPKRDQSAPEWVGGHGWRLKKWPGIMPYIHPTYKDVE